MNDTTKNIITPALFMKVNSDSNSNESTITIVPNCRDKECKQFVIRLNKHTGKFFNKGIKETKAAFNAFVEYVKAITPAWKPETDIEQVLFNTMKHASYCNVGVAFFIDEEYMKRGGNYPMRVMRLDCITEAQNTEVTIDSYELVRPVTLPSCELSDIDFSVSITLDTETLQMAGYWTDERLQASYTFSGSIKILRSNKSQFVQFMELKTDAPDTILRAIGLREMDIQALIIRAIAAGGKYVNDGKNALEAVEVNQYAYSTLMRTMERCEADFMAGLAKYNAQFKPIRESIYKPCA